MAPPTRTATNILVGDAVMYLAPAGTAAPADTIAFEDSWLTPWYHPGYSESGLTFNFDRKEQKHYVEEVSNPLMITTKESTLKVSFGFAESTLENLKYAMGGGTITTVNASSGVIGKKTLKVSDDLEVIALGFEGKNPQGFFRRVIIPRVVSIGKMKTEFDRSKKKTVFNAEFESICSIEDVLIYDKTANAI